MTPRSSATEGARRRTAPRFVPLILLALGLATPFARAEDGKSDAAPSPSGEVSPAAPSGTVAPPPKSEEPAKAPESTTVETRVEATLAPARREKATLDARLADAKAKEPAAVVRRYEELLALFGEYLSHLGETVRAELEAERLEQQSFELAKKKERALHLLEQTEARRARAKLRVDELEASRKGSPADKPSSEKGAK